MARLMYEGELGYFDLDKLWAWYSSRPFFKVTVTAPYLLENLFPKKTSKISLEIFNKLCQAILFYWIVDFEKFVNR